MGGGANMVFNEKLTKNRKLRGLKLRGLRLKLRKVMSVGRKSMLKYDQR